MTDSTFIYVTYIRTTTGALWDALTNPAFMTRYWLGAHAEAEWRVGGAWTLRLADGRVADSGEIMECEPGKRLAIRWRNEFMPELKAEGWSLCTMDLEPEGDTVKLTVTHSIPVEGSKLIGAVSGGWPKILSNLKSLIETGDVILTRAG